MGVTVQTMERAQTAAFNSRTVFWGVLASLLAGAAFFLLSTYAPELRIGRQGGASPLSKSGAGFAGIVKLLEIEGYAPVIGRGPVDAMADDYSLMVVTPSPEADEDVMAEIVKAREGLPTLFVLPKWRTIPLKTHEGWEMRVARLTGFEISRWLAHVGELKLATAAAPAGNIRLPDGSSYKQPDALQTISTEGGIVSVGPKDAVLVHLPDLNFYVLSDPDLLNNQALKDPDGARVALALLQLAAKNADGVTFDMTLFGAAPKHDMFKLLVEPPFLAFTLSILGAAALAVFHGIGRFGPASPDVRAIPFGKRSLVNTTANLLRRAGRLDQLGGRYALLMRSRAGAMLQAPYGLQGAALDQWLETLNKDGEERYSVLSQQARTAQTQASLAVAAQHLHDWIGRRISERK